MIQQSLQIADVEGLVVTGLLSTAHDSASLVMLGSG
jgi:hypothetical protein